MAVKTQTPTCPHCGYAMTDDDMLCNPDDLYWIAPNESEEDVSCPKCKKDYTCVGGYVPFYKNYKIGEGD